MTNLTTYWTRDTAFSYCNIVLRRLANRIMFVLRSFDGRTTLTFARANITGGPKKNVWQLPLLNAPLQSRYIAAVTVKIYSNKGLCRRVAAGPPRFLVSIKSIKTPRTQWNRITYDAPYLWSWSRDTYRRWSV